MLKGHPLFPFITFSFNEKRSKKTCQRTAWETELLSNSFCWFQVVLTIHYQNFHITQNFSFCIFKKRKKWYFVQKQIFACFCPMATPTLQRLLRCLNTLSPILSLPTGTAMPKTGACYIQQGRLVGFSREWGYTVNPLTLCTPLDSHWISSELYLYFFWHYCPPCPCHALSLPIF